MKTNRYPEHPGLKSAKAFFAQRGTLANRIGEIETQIAERRERLAGSATPEQIASTESAIAILGRQLDAAKKSLVEHDAAGLVRADTNLRGAIFQLRENVVAEIKCTIRDRIGSECTLNLDAIQQQEFERRFEALVEIVSPVLAEGRRHIELPAVSDFGQDKAPYLKSVPAIIGELENVTARLALAQECRADGCLPKPDELRRTASPEIIPSGSGLVIPGYHAPLSAEAEAALHAQEVAAYAKECADLGIDPSRGIRGFPLKVEHPADARARRMRRNDEMAKLKDKAEAEQRERSKANAKRFAA